MRFVDCCIFAFIFFWTSHGFSQEWNLDSYIEQPGLTAGLHGDTLRVVWDGSDNRFCMDMGISGGTPVIWALSYQDLHGAWRKMAVNLVPEFSVVSGVRRVTQQQTEPLGRLGVPLTVDKLNEIKWDAFWDAPLFLSDEPPLSHESSIPAAEPFANHPGMPRDSAEVTRAVARYDVSEGVIKTNGSRLEITFPGVEAGIFKGYVQFDIFRGSNLIRQVLMGRTEHTSAAYKYSAGLNGFAVDDSRTLWRDLAGNIQDYHFGARIHPASVAVKSANRLIAAEMSDVAIACFPPPHSFYWARESEENLGYSYYRKSAEDKFALGVRQAELEEDEEFLQNFALYNARPGTWQRMPVFYELVTGSGEEALEAALRYTHKDKFKALPGYKVMGHHYHVGLIPRLKEKGGFDQRINDIGTIKSVGINIYGVIDGVRGPARHDRGDGFLQTLDEYYDAAESQSDHNFLVMPSDENSTGGRPPFLGGHYDIIPSGRLYWKPGREAGEPLIEIHPKYDTVYNLGTPDDMMRMAEIENVLISMPHPQAKRSTGYPDAILEEDHFQHENYFALGYRWGMGIDGSAVRLGQYRFLPLWDRTNNAMVSRGKRPKFALAISEARSDLGHRGKPPYDDTYGMSPVNYLQLDKVPGVDNMSSVIDVLKAGKYFVTSGEVLIPNYEVTGEGDNRKVVAEIEWTFPLDFIEVVYGDGEKTDRIIKDMRQKAAFGRDIFEIEVTVGKKKWMRFAAWDVAGNGALTQPVWLKPE